MRLSRVAMQRARAARGLDFVLIREQEDLSARIDGDCRRIVLRPQTEVEVT